MEGCRERRGSRKVRFLGVTRIVMVRPLAESWRVRWRRGII